MPGLLAGLKRLAVLAAATAGAIGLVSGLLGLAAGASLGRSLSLGFYVTGAFVIVLGFFAGNRGPLRPRSGGDEQEAFSGLFGIGIASRGARKASADERADALGTAAIFLLIGLWLIFLGVVADSTVEVV